MSFESACPICEIGYVFNFVCDHCDAEYCPVCKGVLNDDSNVVDPCDCDLEMFDE